MNMFRLVMALNNRPGGNSVSWLLEVGVQKNFPGGGEQEIISLSGMWILVILDGSEIRLFVLMEPNLP